MIRYYSSDHTVDYGFEYNDANLPVKVVDNIHNTVTERVYNSNHDLVEEKMANGLTLNYEYDSMGRMTAICYLMSLKSNITLTERS